MFYITPVLGIYIMHEVWIEAIHGLSWPSLVSKLCAASPLIVQVFSHVLLHEFMCVLGF